MGQRDILTKKIYEISEELQLLRKEATLSPDYDLIRDLEKMALRVFDSLSFLEKN